MPHAQKVLLMEGTDRLPLEEVLQIVTIPEIEFTNRGHNAPTPVLFGNTLDQIPKDFQCRLGARSVKRIDHEKRRCSARPVGQHLYQLPVKAKLYTELSKAAGGKMVNRE